MTQTADWLPSQRADSGPPPSGAWRPGDPPGHRRWAAIQPLKTEAGGVIREGVLAYETWGTLAADGGNAILLLHALTGDSHAAGEAGPGHPTPGWWGALVGAGRAIDPGEWFIVVPNVLGGCQGSTGPSSYAGDGRPWGSRFPVLTVRDQAAAEAMLADELGIEQWAAVIGGSMGGMRALEWAVGYPGRVRRLGLLACGPVASADQIAWAGVQVAAITADPFWRGGDYYDAAPGEGPHRGLATARRIAHLTYRTAGELEFRFGRSPRKDADGGLFGGFAVESYLDHQALKLVRRFDAGSYVTLTSAMNHHDVGRDRGGVGQALPRVRAAAVIAGISSDRLYPLAEQRHLAEALPGKPPVLVINSIQGHDAFLTESDQIAEFIRMVLQ
jgi:homoserine O-acetyltransferase